MMHEAQAIPRQMLLSSTHTPRDLHINIDWTLESFAILPCLIMPSRQASHAGSWYSDNKQKLSDQLDSFLADVPASTTPIGTVSAQSGDVSIPTQGARAIIAP